MHRCVVLVGSSDASGSEMGPFRGRPCPIAPSARLSYACSSALRWSAFGCSITKLVNAAARGVTSRISNTRWSATAVTAPRDPGGCKAT